MQIDIPVPFGAFGFKKHLLPPPLCRQNQADSQHDHSGHSPKVGWFLWLLLSWVVRWCDQVLLRPWKFLLSLESVNDILECAQTIQSLFFSIHESMSEMFSFCLIWCVLGDIYNSNSTFLESFYHFSYVAVLWHMYSFILANYCIYHLATMKQWWNNSKQIYV